MVSLALRHPQNLGVEAEGREGVQQREKSLLPTHAPGGLGRPIADILVAASQRTPEVTLAESRA